MIIRTICGAGTNPAITTDALTIARFDTLGRSVIHGGDVVFKSDVINGSAVIHHGDVILRSAVAFSS